MEKNDITEIKVDNEHECFNVDDKARTDGQNYINSLANTVAKNSEAFDRAIITLSSGFLALSITFIDRIVKLSECTCICLLILSWSFFVISIVINFISIFVAQNECEKRRKLAEKCYFKGDKKSCQSLRDMNNPTQIINIISAGAYIIGTILITIFVSINLTGKGVSNMAEQKKTGNNQQQSKPPEVRQDSVISEGRIKAGGQGAQGAVPPPPPSDTTIVNNTKSQN
ncbi:MAG: hypothetical protein GX660_05475 [Clostridiaceae bacterium]|nr:hypothetical protein [Clostridiaceae bacterium]